MFDTEYENEINKIPLSDNAIARHTTDLSEDNEANIKNVMNNALYIIQTDESCDNSGRENLMAFVYFIHEKKKDYRTILMLQRIKYKHIHTLVKSLNIIRILT